MSPPFTFQQCFVNDELDLARYLMYRRRIDEMDDAMSAAHQIYFNIQKRKRKLDSEYVKSSKRKCIRTVQAHRILVREDDGSLREVKPQDTLWYLLYVRQPPRNHSLDALFRRQFRLPYGSFLQLLNDLRNHPSFREYNSCDCTGRKSTELSLLLLGAMRYLGRSWTFDCIEEATAIARETNRRFFLKFIEYGSTNMFRRYVIDAAKLLTMNELTNLFKQAGFNGCIGSTDCTHLPMLKCSNWARNIHKGSKMHVPSRTYNVTVTHWRQIIGTTIGHPGTFNDKTVIMFDRLLGDIHNNHLKDDHQFTLLEKDANNNIAEKEYVGAWFIVDNGYLNWSCTVPPMKHALSNFK